MPIYNLAAYITVSAYTKVDANSLEEAIEISRNREVMLCPDAPSLYHYRPEEFWIIEEADGEPEGIREDK